MILFFENVRTVPQLLLRFQNCVFVTFGSAKKGHYLPKPLDATTQNLKWRANCQNQEENIGYEGLILKKNKFCLIRTAPKHVLRGSFIFTRIQQ